MVPPVFADAGSVRIELQDLGYYTEFELYTKDGKPQVSSIDFKLDWNPDLVNFEIDCYSDMTRFVTDDIIFHKNFLIKRALEKYKPEI